MSRPASSRQGAPWGQARGRRRGQTAQRSYGDPALRGQRWPCAPSCGPSLGPAFAGPGVLLGPGFPRRFGLGAGLGPRAAALLCTLDGPGGGSVHDLAPGRASRSPIPLVPPSQPFSERGCALDTSSSCDSGKNPRWRSRPAPAPSLPAGSPSLPPSAGPSPQGDSRGTLPCTILGLRPQRGV